MSSLKDRLKRLTGSSTTSEPSNSGEGSSTAGRENLEEKVEADEASNVQGEPQDKANLDRYAVEALDQDWTKLEAALIRNEWGSFIRRRRVYPMDYVHGDYRLSELFGCAGELAAFQGSEEGAGYVSAQQLLFFDTETTGLGVGAGNVPFMIGIGFWETDGFIVEQLFIRNPAEELAMLAYLKPLMRRYPYLVSYNGKTFDWPLLQNRFVLNRMKEEIPVPFHLDFLYPSRSLWKNTLPSCRLSKVEEARLGFNRIDDVPGSMAPALYFLYLAERKPSVVGPVFVHNELDILSLAGLAVLFAQSLRGHTEEGCESLEERYRLGLWLHKMGKAELSCRVLSGITNHMIRGVERKKQEELIVSLYVPLAAHYKRIGRLPEAVSLWLYSIELIRDLSGIASLCPSLEPYVEMAMYYEHHEKDYETALLYAEEAQQWEEKKESLRRAVTHRGNPGSTRTRKRWGDGPIRGNKESVPSPMEEKGSPGGSHLEKRISRLQDKLTRQRTKEKQLAGRTSALHHESSAARIETSPSHHGSGAINRASGQSANRSRRRQSTAVQESWNFL